MRREDSERYILHGLMAFAQSAKGLSMERSHAP
jgi:hypothetical protein